MRFEDASFSSSPDSELRCFFLRLSVGQQVGKVPSLFFQDLVLVIVSVERL